jgi:hypothetical protein
MGTNTAGDLSSPLPSCVQVKHVFPDRTTYAFMMWRLDTEASLYLRIVGSTHPRSLYASRTWERASFTFRNACNFNSMSPKCLHSVIHKGITTFNSMWSFTSTNVDYMISLVRCLGTETYLVARSVQCLTTDWMTGVRSQTKAEQQRQRIFLLVSASRPALRLTQPLIQWVPGVLSPGVKRGRGVMLTTHPI